MKKLLLSLVCIVTAVIPAAQAAFIVYDMDYLQIEGVEGTFDGWVYRGDGTKTIQITDPSDGAGRMDRLWVNFADTAGYIQAIGNTFYVKGSDLGFIGSDALSTSATDYKVDFAYGGNWWGDTHQNTIFWVAPQSPGEFSNNTAYNDIAYGFKIVDQGTIGTLDDVDAIQLVGAVYTTGSDTVIGQTADQLTAMIPEPATVGLLACSGAAVLLIRRRLMV